MKRYLFMAMVVVIVVLVYGTLGRTNQVIVESFDIKDYQRIITSQSLNMAVGPISDLESAKQEAVTVFFDTYGIDPTCFKMYWVRYDPNHDVWHVAAFLDDPTDNEVVFGNCPEVLIRSNGEVLAVWMDR